MAFIAAAVSAAIIYVVNTWLLKKSFLMTISIAGPLVEELSKTLIAVSFGAYIPHVHIVFGLIEAVADVRSGRLGFAPALASMTGHAVYGYATWYATVLTGALPSGIAVALSMHIVWNIYVLRGMRGR